MQELKATIESYPFPLTDADLIDLAMADPLDLIRLSGGWGFAGYVADDDGRPMRCFFTVKTHQEAQKAAGFWKSFVAGRVI